MTTDYGTVLHAEDDLHLWQERRPGMSIFGAYVGRVVLTSSHLLFLSTGGSGAAKAALTAAVLGPLAGMTFGRTRTNELDLSALRAEGSLIVPLAKISAHSAQKRCDCATYVAVQYAGAKDDLRELSFMPKTSLNWAGAELWAMEISGAREMSAGAYR